VEAKIKDYADALYGRSLHKSARILNEERVTSQQEMAARRSSTALPLSGPEIQRILHLYVQHIERCMEARLESFRKAYDEAKRDPTDDEFSEILTSVKDAQMLQIKHSAQALGEFVKSRGAPGSVVDMTGELAVRSAQGHDRMLADWRVWRGQVRLRTVSAMERTFEDPYPTTLSDIEAEIDYWATRRHRRRYEVLFAPAKHDGYISGRPRHSHASGESAIHFERNKNRSCVAWPYIGDRLASWLCTAPVLLLMA